MIRIGVILLILSFISCKKETNEEIIETKQENIVGIWAVETSTKKFHGDTLVLENSYLTERIYNHDGTGIHSAASTNSAVGIKWLYQFSPEQVSVIAGGPWNFVPEIYNVEKNTLTEQIWSRERILAKYPFEIRKEYRLKLTKK